MGLDTAFHSLGTTLQVFLIDLLLSGDNAVVIALACRSLPRAQMRPALLIGTAGAIVLRVVFTSLTSFILSLPVLKLVGGAALIAIAIKLILEEEEEERGASARLPHEPVGLWSAVGMVVVADVVMSVDNVVALAAAAQGSLFFLVSGLLLSVPLLMFGSMFVTTLLMRYPLLIRGGGALLGWLAGDIAIADPLVAEWVSQQSPALAGIVPILSAVYVLVESRIIEEARVTAVRPLRRAPREGARQMATATSELVAEQEFTVPDGTDIRALDSLARKPTAAQAMDESYSAPMAAARATLRRVSPGIVVAVTIVAIGFVIFLTTRWKSMLPTPNGLDRYVCPGGDTLIYYRPGLNIVQMSSPDGTISGVIRNEKIDWGDYAAANKSLGFAPPVEIKRFDAKSVRISGGRYVDIDCVIR